MRLFLGLIFPLLLQIVAFVIVFFVSQGGGSFMGLLAIPCAIIAVPTLIIVGLTNVRAKISSSRLVLSSLGIALIPPILLLIFRAIETVI